MKKYMVVCLAAGMTWATFFDDILKAENYRKSAECSIGAYAEVYERTNIEDGDRAYQFLYC